ncbi:MAG: hydroxymethylglutaryl-CoA lyase [Lachnospiraceae bacterium]|nr:hydroxymethylglutaryl-CoA lyase [Lachnospiraceae bacterium]
MGKIIDIYEVGPRDGFQSVKCRQITTREKLDVIDAMFDAGVHHMEYTSFVSPKAIPQLADAKEVTAYVLKKHGDRDLFVLIPNLRGAQTAYELGIKKAAYVVSMSASHNQANINRTHEQSLEAFLEIRNAYPDMEIIVDLSTAFGCPFEGKVRDTEEPTRFLKPYVDAGMKSCCLCDTIGIADPEQVKGILRSLQKAYPALELMVHFHDTRGCGMVNTLTAIGEGITSVQSTLGGLGGCPFAPGASGNLATEDLVWMLNEAGYETGISFEKLVRAAKNQADTIEGLYSGHQISVESNFKSTAA